MVATYTGTVSWGHDQAGLFGAPGNYLTGDAYIAKYMIDTSQGDHVNGLPVYDSVCSGCLGGVIPAVDASLTINGITQHIAGDYLSAAITEPTSPYTADAAQDYNYVDAVDQLNYVISYQNEISEGSLSDPVSLSNTYTFGCFLFYRTKVGSTSANCGSPGTMQISAMSGAPEPATWAMMLLGIGGIGAALRTSRRKQLATVREIAPEASPLI